MKSPVPLEQRLLAFQSEVSAIAKDSNNPFYNSQYFDINKLLKEVKPLLTKHGIVLLQPLTYIESSDGAVRPALRTSLVNVDDARDRMDSVTVIPALDDPQKQGGVITYFRRYSLVAMLSLESEDDDGNAASGKGNKKSTQSNGSKKAMRELVW